MGTGPKEGQLSIVSDHICKVIDFEIVENVAPKIRDEYRGTAQAMEDESL
jgi:hypothetical protein